MNFNNNCTFEGRLVKDLEIKSSGKGQNALSYVQFTVAVDRKLTKDQRDAKKNGQDVVTADFPQFVCFGKSAETMCQYFSKGDLIRINAVFQTNKLDDGNGGVKYLNNFKVEDWGFANGGNSNNNNNSGGGKNNNNKPQGNKNKQKDEDINDDYTADDEDIPF